MKLKRPWKGLQGWQRQILFRVLDPPDNNAAHSKRLNSFTAAGKIMKCTRGTIFKWFRSKMYMHILRFVVSHLCTNLTHRKKRQSSVGKSLGAASAVRSAPVRSCVKYKHHMSVWHILSVSSCWQLLTVFQLPFKYFQKSKIQLLHFLVSKILQKPTPASNTLMSTPSDCKI